MRQIITKGIVLSRTNFGEADRIITVITPDQGKLRLMARGVRKSKSKMAGGIELFSISEIGFLPGKGEVYTLTTSRLQTHYGNIAKDVERTRFAYEFLKMVNKITEDNVGEEFFNYIVQVTDSLNTTDVKLELVKLWSDVQLLKITGHLPNLASDHQGKTLEAIGGFNFDYEHMAFVSNGSNFSAAHIKLLRLATKNLPTQLNKVNDADSLLPKLLNLLGNIKQVALHMN